MDKLNAEQGLLPVRQEITRLAELYAAAMARWYSDLYNNDLHLAAKKAKHELHKAIDQALPG